MKFKNYKKGITGLVTVKLDGVQCVYKDGIWLSRKDKPLYNLPVVAEGIYEYFNKDWNTSVSDVRTHNKRLLDSKNLYRLDVIDSRLLIDGTIEEAFKKIIDEGGEGLVIHTDTYLYKMKREDTHDVEVIGWVEGTGKYVGMMGALITSNGKVGTGFKDKDRRLLTEKYTLGKIIEVSCMGKTINDKFRHPRFKRLRLDK